MAAAAAMLPLPITQLQVAVAAVNYLAGKLAVLVDLEWY
jgi:hypothetical protein